MKLSRFSIKKDDNYQTLVFILQNQNDLWKNHIYIWKHPPISGFNHPNLVG